MGTELRKGDQTVLTRALSKMRDVLRFAPYALRRETVVLRRLSRALGDNLMLSMLAREIKKAEPARKVVVETNWPELFRGNPHVDLVLQHKVALRYCMPDYRVGPDTDVHILDQMALLAGLATWERKVDLFLQGDPTDPAEEALGSGYIAVCPQGKKAHSANRKEWGAERFQELIDGLPGERFVQIGLSDDPLLSGAADRRGRDIRSTARILSRAKTAVILEGGLMHVCNAVGLHPVVIYGGLIRSEISTYATQLAVTSRVPCGPCFRSHGSVSPCPTMDCMKTITAEYVARLIAERRYLGGGVVEAG